MLNNLSNAACAGDYYGQLAYRSDVIPPQKNQVEELNRTGLDRSASLRLPWGNTSEVVPPSFMSDDPPKKLRKLERREDLAEKHGLQVENNHECFRHAPLGFQAWLINMNSFLGWFWMFLFSPMLLVTFVLISPLFTPSEKSFLSFIPQLGSPQFCDPFRRADYPDHLCLGYETVSQMAFQKRPRPRMGIQSPYRHDQGMAIFSETPVRAPKASGRDRKTLLRI